MLTLFGIDYVIDHVIAEIKKQNDDLSYRVYITDALRAIVNNVSQTGEQRTYITITKRWFDIIQPDVPEDIEEEDPRSCEEIASDIWDRIRGKGGGK